MSEDEHQNRISLQDNSDGPMSEPENKENPPENPETEAPPKQGTYFVALQILLISTPSLTR